MEKISIERLKQLLEKEKTDLQIVIKNKPDEVCSLGFMMELVINTPGGALNHVGYTAEFHNGKKNVNKKFKKVDKMLAYLQKKQVIDADGDITVLMYCNRYDTYQEYSDAQAFGNIDMTGLLAKYLPQADRFSLTCPYCVQDDIDHPFGTCRLSKQHADYALKKVREWTMQTLKHTYENMTDAQNQDLPPFDALIENITKEIENYRVALSEKELCDNAGNSFMCDRFSMGETQYKSPQELWHFYSCLEQLFVFRWITDIMQKGTVQRPLDAELDSEQYSQLKQDLIDTEVTFCWHCTVSSQLSKVFYFRITDNSVAWLKKLKNDYDLTELQDLAFYNGDKILFSSCTHEGFHNDCTDGSDD